MQIGGVLWMRPRVPATRWIVELALLLSLTTKTHGSEGTTSCCSRCCRSSPSRRPATASSARAGTRACAFDFDLSPSIRNLQRQKRRVFERAGIANIATYINAMPGVPRESAMSTRVLCPTSTALSRRSTQRSVVYRALLSDKAFLDYLARKRIDYLIMPSAANRSYEKRILGAATDAIRIRRADPRVRIVEDKDYVLYDLAALHAAERAGR